MLKKGKEALAAWWGLALEGSVWAKEGSSSPWPCMTQGRDLQDVWSFFPVLCFTSALSVVKQGRGYLTPVNSPGSWQFPWTFQQKRNPRSAKMHTESYGLAGGESWREKLELPKKSLASLKCSTIEYLFQFWYLRYFNLTWLNLNLPAICTFACLHRLATQAAACLHT